MTLGHTSNVLVTGATGLVGGWLVEALVARGARVTCLIRDWVPDSRLISSGLVAQLNVVRGELEDYVVALRTLNEYEIDTVFHLGAQTLVGTAARDARATFEANIRGTWNLLDACRSHALLVKRVVVASSDKAYGSHARLPYTEDTPLEGRYPYDVSKSCADLIALSYFHSYRTPIVVGRCGNIFGGGDLNFSRLVPGTIRSALRGEAPVIRSDGEFVRDYIYVRDAVQGYLALADGMPDDQIVGQAFNFGPGQPVSVRDVVQKILELMGQTQLVPQILNEASREIRNQYLDASKAGRVLNWQPTYTLDEGLKETIAWYREYIGHTV